MEQKRGGLVPIGKVAVRLPGIEGRGRAMSARARHHFTTLRQVNQLIEASEAEPDLGFMARLLALCSLPRTDPKNRLQYIRRNGPYMIGISAGVGDKLPYGNIPRLLLAWVCSEAVRTQKRELVLGRSLYEFMHKLGMEDRSGSARGDRTRLKNQMRRLFRSTISLVYTEGDVSASVSSLVADRTLFWWDTKQPDADSTIQLGEEFFNEIIAHPVPLDLNILRAVKRSTLGLDLYLWLTYRTFGLTRPLRLSWPQIYRQFGADPARGGRCAHRGQLPYEVSPRVEEDQRWHGQTCTTRRLRGRCCSHPRHHASRRRSCASSNRRPCRARGCPVWRDRGPGLAVEEVRRPSAENPHHGPKPRMFHRGPPGDAVRALRPARASGTTPTRRARNASRTPTKTRRSVTKAR